MRFGLHHRFWLVIDTGTKRHGLVAAENQCFRMERADRKSLGPGKFQCDLFRAGAVSFQLLIERTLINIRRDCRKCQPRIAHQHLAGCAGRGEDQLLFHRLSAPNGAIRIIASSSGGQGWLRPFPRWSGV
ncbi:hypothetical protein D3C86_1052790 [compost metagenome]